MIIQEKILVFKPRLFKSEKVKHILRAICDSLSIDDRSKFRISESYDESVYCIASKDNELLICFRGLLHKYVKFDE